MSEISWGNSWGTSWGVSWGNGFVPPPIPPDPPSGGSGIGGGGGLQPIRIRNKNDEDVHLIFEASMVRDEQDIIDIINLYLMRDTQ